MEVTPDLNKDNLDIAANEFSMCQQQEKPLKSSYMALCQSSGGTLITRDSTFTILMRKQSLRKVTPLAKIMRMVNTEFELEPNHFLN